MSSSFSFPSFPTFHQNVAGNSKENIFRQMGSEAGGREAQVSFLEESNE